MWRGLGSLEVAALLVLLPRAAGARVVATNLAAVGRPRGGGAGARAGRPRLDGSVAARLGRVGPGGDRGQVHGRVAHDLYLEESLDDEPLHALGHVLEQVEGLALVLRERVALPVAAQPDALLEVIDR